MREREHCDWWTKSRRPRRQNRYDPSSHPQLMETESVLPSVVINATRFDNTSSMSCENPDRSGLQSRRSSRWMVFDFSTSLLARIDSSRCDCFAVRTSMPVLIVSNSSACRSTRIILSCDVISRWDWSNAEYTDCLFHRYCECIEPVSCRAAFSLMLDCRESRTGNVQQCLPRSTNAESGHSSRWNARSRDTYERSISNSIWDGLGFHERRSVPKLSTRWSAMSECNVRRPI